ncbi:MAG: hypothetical protein ACOX68_00160 [Candidatus Limivicinus sp.]|jgi:general stress protein 26
MADYKDIIKGTFKSIADKVKDVAENNSVKDICEAGADRAKAYGAIAKLTLEINGEVEELKRVYTEIGKLYYEQAHENPDGFFASLFSQVEKINEEIQEDEDEIEILKTQIDCASGKDIEVDIGEFEDVVADTEKDGSGESSDESAEPAAEASEESTEDTEE